jgi:ribose transport system permease protein
MIESSSPPAAAESTDAANGTAGAERRDRITPAEFIRRYGVLVAWAVVILVFSLLRPDTFPTKQNFETIFSSQAVLMILALALVVSFRVGEFDLSVAGVMSLAMVLVGTLNVQQGWPVALVVVVVLAVGILVGLVNAFFVVTIGVSSIIVTLGTGTVLVGIGVAIERTIVSGISESLVNAVTTEIIGLPLAFYYGLGLTVLVWYVFEYTAVGRYMYFVGAGREVSQLSGLRVDAIRTGSLVVTSMLAALAGITFAGQLGASDPNISESFLLPAFAAAFLGSTTIKPGRFNPWGTFVAVYFLVTGITGLELLGYSGWISDVFYGGSVVLAVALAELARRRELSRRARKADNTSAAAADRPVEAHGR